MAELVFPYMEKQLKGEKNTQSCSENKRNIENKHSHLDYIDLHVDLWNTSSNQSLSLTRR